MAKPSSPAARSLTLALLASVTSFAAAQGTEAAPAPETASFLRNLTVTGHLDTFFQFDFGRPAAGNLPGFPGAGFINGRQFDGFHRTLSLGALQLNVQRKTSAESPFGFLFQFSGGKVADVLALTEPGLANGQDSLLKYLQQGYFSYAAPNGQFSVDFGKYLTWIGYEGIITPDQDFYSRSFLFFITQPTYNAGLRASAPLGKSGITGSLYLVNGWNEVEDSNAEKSYGASFSGTFGKTSATLSYYGGKEGPDNASGVSGFGGGAVTKANALDGYLVHNVNEKLKLALNGTYLDMVPATSGSAAKHGKAYGFAAYARYTATPKLALALRYEQVTDKGGNQTGFDANYGSLAATLDLAYDPRALFRIEVRYDKSSIPAFNADAGLKSDRTTLLLSHVFRF